MIQIGRLVRLNVVTLVLKMEKLLTYTVQSHEHNVLIGEVGKKKNGGKKAHEVETIEPGHQEEKKLEGGKKTQNKT